MPTSLYGRKVSLESFLLDDPDLLDYEIWRIFEIEPRPGFLHDLSTCDFHSPEFSWSAALVRLSEQGRISRQRLLDTSLDALHRDFHEIRAAWFAGFHEALCPTIEERAKRTKRYASLLWSRNCSTVSFALKSLAALDKAVSLEPQLVLENIRPALSSRFKNVAQTALKLVQHAVEHQKDLRIQAATAATEAFLHPSADVHQMAVDIIERYGQRDDRNVRTLVQERMSGLSASQRNRMEAWLRGPADDLAGPPVTEEPEDIESLARRAESLDPDLANLATVPVLMQICRHGGGDVPALEFDGTEMPRLDPDKRIQPVEDLDSLIDLFASVIERPAPASDVERVLDGVSRLCDWRPSNLPRKLAPLWARAQHFLDPKFRLSVLRGPLCALALDWAGNRTSTLLLPWQRSVLDIFYLRTADIATRAARQAAAPLLSAPTHDGGWIDPLALLSRVRIWDTLHLSPSRLDQTLALLRLAPDHRAAALAQAPPPKDEFTSALRYALGDEIAAIGDSAPLWVASARARAPSADDPRIEARHPHLGPDAGLAARYVLRRPSRPRERWGLREPLIDRVPPVPLLPGVEFDPLRFFATVDREPPVSSVRPEEFPSAALHFRRNFWWDADAISWLATVWPLWRESLFADGFEQIAGMENPPTEARRNRPFLEALFDPDVPLKEIAVLLLASALSAKHPDESILATDALIAAIDDGRLDGKKLGDALALLLPSGLIKPSRWAKSLGSAARVSPLHVRVIAAAIERSLRGESEYPPGSLTWANLQALLELLKELSIEAGDPVSRPETREYLSRLKASGKTARLVKELLALEKRTPNTHQLSAALHALARRIERAECWCRRRRH
jgi:hypothetical protein